MWQTVIDRLEALFAPFVAIWELLVGISNNLISIAEYILSLFADILFIVLYIGDLAVSGIINWFSWMPIVCVSLLMALIGIAVLYKIIGRE